MDPPKTPLAKQTAAGIPLTGACDARGVPTKMSHVFGPFKDPKKGFSLEMFFARRKNVVSFAANQCSNKCLSDGWLVATRDYGRGPSRCHWKLGLVWGPEMGTWCLTKI